MQSQSALLKASTDLRFAQREVTEYYGQMFGFPTRTELDDVHRTVTELKREYGLCDEICARSFRNPAHRNSQKLSRSLPGASAGRVRDVHRPASPQGKELEDYG